MQLKADFLVVQHLRNLSGWSWDEENHVPTTTDEVWDAHLAVRILDSAIFMCMYQFSIDLP